MKLATAVMQKNVDLYYGNIHPSQKTVQIAMTHMAQITMRY
jgi:hypothetical protein